MVVEGLGSGCATSKLKVNATSGRHKRHLSVARKTACCLASVGFAAGRQILVVFPVATGLCRGEGLAAAHLFPPVLQARSNGQPRPGRHLLERVFKNLGGEGVRVRVAQAAAFLLLCSSSLLRLLRLLRLPSHRKRSEIAKGCGQTSLRMAHTNLAATCTRAHGAGAPPQPLGRHQSRITTDHLTLGGCPGHAWPLCNASHQREHFERLTPIILQRSQEPLSLSQTGAPPVPLSWARMASSESLLTLGVQSMSGRADDSDSRMGMGEPLWCLKIRLAARGSVDQLLLAGAPDVVRVRRNLEEIAI